LYNQTNLSPHLYFVRDFKQDSNRDTFLYNKEKEQITNFDSYREAFKKEFDKLLIEIFDEEKDFTQTPNKNNCQYCNFKNICNRN
ncbi:MAG: PD-(D/E)XK nuclease family protein, partial [Bacteroidales bacterium]|nr:PD-(D/E)XK nuclease family protein [Bacteroidales bacterium]